MTAVGLVGLLRAAAEAGRGVGAFNVFSLEHAEGLMAGAARAGTPVVLQISQNAVRYHGSLAPITLATLALAQAGDVDAVVHLDHATDVRLVQEAVALGVGSVMFDGSELDYDTNVRVTAEVVAHCHAHGVDVEAELGEVGGKDGVHAPGARTRPDEAAAFVAATGVDALAVAVGSSHAMTERRASLDLELIKDIRAVVEVPLVLHGSSGVPDHEIVRAVRAGMTKINIATHLNKIFTGTVRSVLADQPGLVDSRKYLGPARDALATEAARLLAMLEEAASSGV
jgi:fructose-bisphosphate aldolase, class II